MTPPMQKQVSANFNLFAQTCPSKCCRLVGGVMTPPYDYFVYNLAFHILL